MKTMFILASRKLVSSILAITIIMGQFSLAFMAIGLTLGDVVLAQETQTTDPAVVGNLDDNEEEEPAQDLNEDEVFVDEALAAAQPIEQTIAIGELFFKDSSPIVLNPSDQARLELYLQPEEAAKRVLEGNDAKAYDDLVEGVFDFRPSLDQFPDAKRVREVVEIILGDNKKLNEFIDALEKSLSDNGFVTEADKLIVQNLAQTLNTASGLDVKERKDQLADQTIDQLTKLFEQSQNFSPIIVSLAQIIERLDLDRRVVQSLIYLVTPRAQGGAGHERIKVERIWKDYASLDESKNISKESLGAENVSRHHFGQAFDISEIDNIKCTLYRKGLIRKKKSTQPPVPIKVAFQSEDSLAQAIEGSNGLPLGLSMEEIFKEFSLNNLVDGLSDFDIENLNEGSLKDATLTDILTAVGGQMIARVLGGQELKGYDFNSIANSVGQALLADKLSLPASGIKGGNIDELEENIGRAVFEERLKLSPGSLQGINRSQLLRSVGARRIEALLNIRLGSLGLGGNAQVSPDTIKIRVGQGYIEQALDLKPGSLSGASAQDVRKTIGDFKFKTLFSENNSGQIDQRLKIDPGTTAEFVSSGNIIKFKQFVGKKILDDTFGAFVNYAGEENKQDEAFATPQGSIKRFLSGDVAALEEIGSNELAQRLTFSDAERNLLKNWLGGKTQDLSPISEQVSSVLKITNEEFERVFTTGGKEVFRNAGEKKLLQSIAGGEINKKLKNQAEQAFPELLTITQNIEFRTDRLRDLKNDVIALEKIIGQTNDTQAIRQLIDAVLGSPNPNNIRNAAAKTGLAWERLANNQEIGQKEGAAENLESIRKNFRAALDGKYPETVSSISEKDIRAPKSGGLEITANDLLDLIDQNKTPQELVLAIGLRNIEAKLGMPQEALFMFSKEREKSPEAFFTSTGRAKIFELYGQNVDIESVVRSNPNQADVDLGLRQGTAKELINGAVNEEEFIKIVGRQALILGGIRQITDGLRVDGLTFDPNDIYSLITGGQQSVFTRVAGYKLDEVLNLYPGSGYSIINAPDAGAREDAIAIAGGAMVGQYLGIGPIDFRGGNPIRSTGANIIESTFGLPEGSMRHHKDIKQALGDESNTAGLERLFDDPGQSDRILGLNEGTTQKLHDGTLTLEQYVNLVGKNTLQNQIIQSPKTLETLVDTLGIDSELANRLRSFVPVILNIVSRNDIGTITNWSQADRVDVFNALDGIFSLEFDRRAHFKPGTFAEIFANPDQARKIVVREGINILDSQFGLGGKLELAYNFFALAPSRLPTNQATLVEQANNEITNRVKQLVFEQTGVSLLDEDVQGIASGDIRTLQYIAFAQASDQFSKLVNGAKVPLEYLVAFQDFKQAFQGKGEEDLAAISIAGDEAVNKAIQENPATDEIDLGIIRGLAEENSSKTIRLAYQKNLQFKTFDVLAYRVDSRIPAGFTRAIVDGDSNAKLDVLLGFFERGVIQNNLGIDIAPGTLATMKDYFTDRSEENLQKVLSTGVVNTLEAELNKHNTLGFALPEGTLNALLNYGLTGDINELAVGLASTLQGIVAKSIFGWSDKTFGFPPGTSYQLAQTGYGISQGTQNPADAYSLVINLVFQKQVGQMEETLGLVPGTGPLLVSMLVQTLMSGGPNPYVLAAFVLFNLIGFNKTQLICTGDGYYPKIEPINEDLYLGLGEFNGLGAQIYRENLIKSSQGRIQGLIADLMNMAYRDVVSNELGGIIFTERDTVNDEFKPIQIVTKRSEDFDAFFGSETYNQVFNDEQPGEFNRQGILTGPDYFVDNWVHVGF